MPIFNPSTASGGSTAASTGTFTQSYDYLWPQVIGFNANPFPVSGGITATRVAVELSSGLTTVFTCSTDKVATIGPNYTVNLTNLSGANSTAVAGYWIAPGSSADANNQFRNENVNNNTVGLMTGPRFFMEPGESYVLGNATANMTASCTFYEMDSSTDLIIQRGQVASTAGTSIYTCPDGKHAYVKHIDVFWQSTAAAAQAAAIVLPDGSTYDEKYAVTLQTVTGQTNTVLNAQVVSYLSSGDQVFLRSPSTEPLNYRMPVFETTG